MFRFAPGPLLLAASGFVALLFLILLRRPLGGCCGWHNLEEGLDRVAIAVSDLYVGIITQVLQVLFSGFWRSLSGYRLPDLVLVKGRSVAARGARINAQDLIAFVRSQRVADLARLQVLDRVGDIGSQVGKLKEANLTTLGPAAFRVSFSQSCKVR